MNSFSVILISNPQKIENEITLLISLFEAGLKYFHLRKPNASKIELQNIIIKIPEKFHSRIILHSHFDLLNQFKLKGIHFTKHTKHQILEYSNWNCHKSISCHSIIEIKNLKYKFDYIFLSPIFDSISKEGYKSNFSESDLIMFLKSKPQNVKVIALGGINNKNIETTVQLCFDGAAILGNIWREFEKNKDIYSATKHFIQFQNLIAK